eukprot:6508787-Pyramimonas_sp.AAC.1
MTTTERAWATQALVGCATPALGEHQDLALLPNDDEPIGRYIERAIVRHWRSMTTPAAQGNAHVDTVMGITEAAHSEAPPTQAITVMLMGREERK